MTTTDPSISPNSNYDQPDAMPSVRSISMEEPWTWLAEGWRDLWRASPVSLAYGLAFAAVSAVLTLALSYFDLSSLVMAMGAGFILLGPLLAVGLYEMSRRLETGEPIKAGEVMFVKTRSPAQLMFLGVILMIAFLAWVRVATLLFALFYGLEGFPPLQDFLGNLLFTPRGLFMFVIGSAIGGVLALVVFAISAISVPLLMVRKIDAVSAMLLSLEAVKKNLFPMILWAWLIALMIGFGIATLYAGLIITFPLIGHGTWHAFKALVDLESDG